VSGGEQDGKRVAIVQSCYIPWKGYFDLINMVDEFILYDDRQYTRRDWRNRNRIKTSQGSQWLTIPVRVKGRYEQRIDETLVSDPDWAVRHWTTIHHAYSATEHFGDYSSRLNAVYASLDDRRLSEINRRLLEEVCRMLGIETTLSWSTDYEAEGAKTERLISLCKAAGADTYLSGPLAREYLDEERFAEAGVRLEYMEYSGYPEYRQLYPPFDHNVTVLDLLFHTGEDARRYMKSFADEG
jgi:WbqC-like protein family